jgi:hypothetical protein
MAAVDDVNDNDLILTSWGDAVRTELNARCVKVNGVQDSTGAAMQMTNHLLLHGASPTHDNHATRKKYVDDLHDQQLNKAGGTMTGALNVTHPTDPSSFIAGVLVAGAQRPEANSLTRKDYVDVNFVQIDGDNQMTGPLLLDNVNPTHDDHACRKIYVDTLIGNRVGISGDTMTGDLELGSGGGPGFSGVHLDTTGHVDQTVATNTSNLALNKISSADVSGGSYILFQTGTSGGTTASTKSSITRNSADTGIAISNCNTTAPSDYRLKDDLGPVVDALARVQALIPRHLAWKQGDDPAFDGFFAHEVTPVAPYCVLGDKDAVYPPDSEINPGEINPQQLDVSGLVPLLVAAFQEALGVIDSLTARVAALEGAG